MNYSLSAYTPVLEGKNPLGNITNHALGWKRSRSFLGDSWFGTFVIKGDFTILEDWFYRGLSRHIVEYSDGMPTWSGFVWEMELGMPPVGGGEYGRRLRRSLDNYFNRVKVQWTDPSDDSTGETFWANELKGHAKYGKKVEILYHDATALEAAKIRDDFLAVSSDTTPSVVGIEQNITEPTLTVTVVGYTATGQYNFVTTADNTLANISDWISAILSTDIGQFLTMGSVDSNTRQVYKYLSTERRAWELLEDLVSLRGPNDEYYRFVITPDRRIHYKEWSQDPIGSFNNGQFYNISKQSMDNAPRRLEPGIYRDMSQAVSAYPTVSDIGSAITGFTDFLLEEVEVDSKDIMIPRLDVYDEEESLRSFVFEKEDLPEDLQ